MFPIIISAIADENQRTFMETVYLDYRTLMYAVAMGVLHHPADAEDAMQTAFCSLCKKISLLQGMDCCTLRSYVVISVRNAAINVLRIRGRKKELLCGEAEYLESLLPDPVDDAAFAGIEEDALTRAVRKLPEKDRALMEMKYVLGLSDKEIAQRFGIKPGSVRTLLMRFRKRLYNHLLQEDERDVRP